MIVSAARKEIKDLNDLLVYCEVGTDRYADKNIGVCMKMLKEHFGANMDGKIASGVAKRYTNA